MKRNKIIVEESRINPKKMIVAKYRNRNKFINREEKLKDEKNYEIEESEKSPEYEEKVNKLEVTYKQKIEKKEVKKLENRQNITIYALHLLLIRNSNIIFRHNDKNILPKFITSYNYSLFLI